MSLADFGAGDGLKAYVADSVLGCFVSDEKGSVIKKAYFPQDKEEVADRLLSIQEGKLLDEHSTLLNKLVDAGYSTVIFERKIKVENKGKPPIEIGYEFPNVCGKWVRENLEGLALKAGFPSKNAFRSFIHEVEILTAKRQMKTALEEYDRILIQAINALDETDKAINTLLNRLREWYSIHFPELEKIVGKHEDYVRIVSEIGDKLKITPEKLTEIGIPKKITQKIMDKAKKSMGAALSPVDIEILTTLAKSILHLLDVRTKFVSYISGVMRKTAPNLSALSGPILGARLISSAGGVEDLAKKPSSTIQVLGAEKALFRHLRKGAKPPKHGVIFQHPMIHNAPKGLRGKIARAMAGKIAIAARKDVYSGEYAGEELKEELNERINEIKGGR